MRRSFECACGNEARYINERGELCCGICPIKLKLDSIKISDVAALLKLARKVDIHSDVVQLSAEFASLLGRVPT
jgi:hypothetical protein